MWNKTMIKPLGKCRMLLSNPKTETSHDVEFIVFKDNDDWSASKCILWKYRTTMLDDKLGEFSGMQHLTVDPEVCPKIIASRRIPIAIRPQLKGELERLTAMGVIAPVEWTDTMGHSSGSCEDEIRRLGGVRIDPHELNKALQREHYTLPILEDMLHELQGATVFFEGRPLVWLLARQVRWRIQPVDDVPDMFWKIQVVSPAFWPNGVKWSVPKTPSRGIAWPTRHHLHSGRHSDLWQDIGTARWEPAKVLRAVSGDRHQTQQRQAGRRTERSHIHWSPNHEGRVARGPS